MRSDPDSEGDRLEISNLLGTKCCRVATNKPLVIFGATYPDADAALQISRPLMEYTDFHSFDDLRNTFGSVDLYKDKYIFDAHGDNHRIVTGISFSQRACYIICLLTQAEYNKGKWE